MNREELKQRYGKGRKNFTNLNLAGLDLLGINLTSADLSGSNLSGTRLTAARLEFANLSGVNLENTDLMRAKLTYANLSRANLRGANMSFQTLAKANLEEANLEGATLLDIRLSGANLTGANLSNADLRRAFLYKVVLRNANLTGVNLTGANLQGSDLTGANLTNAKVDGVCWLEVQLDDPNVLPKKEALIWRISNQGAEDLHGIDLSNANLRETNLQNSDLSEANLSRAYLRHANLAGANLSKANLSGANLVIADLTNANLTNADLTNAQLSGTNFSGANLQDIKFDGTAFIDANLVDAINVPSAILSTSLVPPGHPDIALVNALRAATEGLICSSAKGDPYGIFLWNVADKGEFTLEKLLRAMAYLSPINIDALQQVNSDTELARAYHVLLNCIRGHLVDIEMWQFETESLRESSSVTPYIIVGRTLSGDWFGVTTEIVLEVKIETPQTFYINDGAATKPDNQRLFSAVKEIEPEIDELLSGIEGVQGLVWALTESRDSTLQNLLLATKHFAVKDVEGCEYIFDRDVPENAEQPASFAQLVLNNLHDLRIYFIGSGNVDLYLLGQTQNQDWIGIRTGVIWD